MSQIKVEYINHCGDDLSVCNAARCSFDKQSEWDVESGVNLNTQGINPLDEGWKDITDWNEDYDNWYQKLKSSDVKLINYLAKHKHFSPFNHSFISVRVKAPVFVARQLVKHKFMPWNEVSRRYVKDKPEFYRPDSWRLAADNVKQGSAGDADELLNAQAMVILSSNDIDSLEKYDWLIEKGVCAEEARMVLPQNMMTTWIWSGTLGAFCDMLVLRLDEHTQYESRVVAQKVAEIVKELFPVSYKALVEK